MMAKHSYNIADLQAPKLKAQIKHYMLENDIPRVEIKEDETLVLEPIAHGERAMWISMWLQGELSNKKFLENIKSYVKYHFKWCSWSTKDFLRAVKERRRVKLG